MNNKELKKKIDEAKEKAQIEWSMSDIKRIYKRSSFDEMRKLKKQGIKVTYVETSDRWSGSMDISLEPGGRYGKVTYNGDVVLAADLRGVHVYIPGEWEPELRILEQKASKLEEEEKNNSIIRAAEEKLKKEREKLEQQAKNFGIDTDKK